MWLIDKAKGHQISVSENWYEIPDLSSNHKVIPICKYGG